MGAGLWRLLSPGKGIGTMNRLRLALHVPPSVLVRRGIGMVASRWRARAERAADAQATTYADYAPAGPLTPLLDGLDLPSIRARAAFAVAPADLHRKGMFDLLGSGWVAVRHGMRCAGVEGHAYPPAAAIFADRDGTWLSDRVNSSNLAAAQAVWRLTGADYAPVDWHLDFKSGFRWREDTWHGDIAYGRAPGADIKVPWELARMQHLAVMALAFSATSDPSYARAARDQILDFIAQNPPRFGVNWHCAMDVSIRAANWVMAWSLFRALGFQFDAAFEDALKKSLLDHGRYVARHLEWHPEGRGNHYFADVAGLAFIAAALPPAPETDVWLAFAAQEIPSEIEHQFYSDGGSFEASVPYHRLSLEMAVFSLALLSGFSEKSRQRLTTAEPGALNIRPARPLRLPVMPVTAGVLARIERAAEFLRDLTKPDGTMAQIGDNDSGRFFKITPVYEKTTAGEASTRYANLDGWRGLPVDATYWDENALDGRATVAAAAELLNRPDLADWAGDLWLDPIVVAALGKDRPSLPTAKNSARAVRIQSNGPTGKDVPVAAVEIVVPGSGLCDGLTCAAYPEFGVYLFRSRRIFLAVRCGPIGQEGRGGHAHNDQLAVELAVDGENWIADPGSYLYTADRTWRNAYRSVAAHAAPRVGSSEPGRLDLGDFWLGNQAKARCLFFADGSFGGEHRGFGAVVRREVEVLDDRLAIRDSGRGLAPNQLRLSGRDAVQEHFRPSVPFSPGYGKKHS